MENETITQCKIQFPIDWESPDVFGDLFLNIKNNKIDHIDYLSDTEVIVYFDKSYGRKYDPKTLISNNNGFISIDSDGLYVTNVFNLKWNEYPDLLTLINRINKNIYSYILDTSAENQITNIAISSRFGLTETINNIGSTFELMKNLYTSPLHFDNIKHIILYYDIIRKYYDGENFKKLELDFKIEKGQLISFNKLLTHGKIDIIDELNKKLDNIEDPSKWIYEYTLKNEKYRTKICAMGKTLCAFKEYIFKRYKENLEFILIDYLETFYQTKKNNMTSNF